MELLQQLADSKAKVDFNQGLDIRLVTERNLEMLLKINIKAIHFAYDRWQDKRLIEEKAKMVKELTGWHRNKGRVTVYILVNYDSTLEQDIDRIQFCRSLNWTPYPMIYDKEHCDPVYKRLKRWCSNFIFWECETFEEYDGTTRKAKT